MSPFPGLGGHSWCWTASGASRARGSAESPGPGGAWRTTGRPCHREAPPQSPAAGPGRAPFRPEEHHSPVPTTPEGPAGSGGRQVGRRGWPMTTRPRRTSGWTGWRGRSSPPSRPRRRPSTSSSTPRTPSASARPPPAPRPPWTPCMWTQTASPSRPGGGRPVGTAGAGGLGRDGGPAGAPAGPRPRRRAPRSGRGPPPLAHGEPPGQTPETGWKTSPGPPLGLQACPPPPPLTGDDGAGAGRQPAIQPPPSPPARLTRRPLPPTPNPAQAEHPLVPGLAGHHAAASVQ